MSKEVTLAEIDNRFNNFDNRFSDLIKFLHENMVTRQEFNEKFSDLSNRTTGLEQNVMSIEQNMAGLNNRTAGLEQNMAGLNNRTAGLEQNMAGLQQKFTTFDQHLTSLDQKLTMFDQKTEQRFESVDAELREIRNVLDDHTERLIRVEKRTIEDADATAKDVLKLRRRTTKLENQFRLFKTPR